MPQLSILVEALKIAGQNPLFLGAFLALVLLLAFRRAVKTDKGLDLLHDLVKSKLTRAEFARVANRLIGLVALLCILATAVIALWLVLDTVQNQPSSPSALYRVRVTVVDPGGTPIDDARVWSSMPGEPQEVTGGWEINIPGQSRPAGGKLTVFAAKPSAFSSGQAELTLGEDSNPTVLVQLVRDQSASISGMVQDAQGRAIAGAVVSVVGKRASATSAENGNFLLEINAGVGQTVQIHVEKEGYRALTQSHMAGPDPAVLVLDSE